MLKANCLNNCSIVAKPCSSSSPSLQTKFQEKKPARSKQSKQSKRSMDAEQLEERKRMKWLLTVKGLSEVNLFFFFFFFSVKVFSFSLE